MLELETDIASENEKFASSLAQVNKQIEAKRETDRKIDMQHQRRM